MDAARVYQSAQGNATADGLAGTAVSAIETGTFSTSASVLIRSGFDHRIAAIAAVDSTQAEFESTAEMRKWIEDLAPEVAARSDWPTAETHSAWMQFADRTGALNPSRWSRYVENIYDVTWYAEAPAPGAWLRVTKLNAERIALWSSGFDLLGEEAWDIAEHWRGVLYARRLSDAAGVELRYRGPRDLWKLGSLQHSTDDVPGDPSED
jgi:hypothetical protein